MWFGYKLHGKRSNIIQRLLFYGHDKKKVQCIFKYQPYHLNEPFSINPSYRMIYGRVSFLRYITQWTGVYYIVDDNKKKPNGLRVVYHFFLFHYLSPTPFTVYIFSSLFNFSLYLSLSSLLLICKIGMCIVCRVKWKPLTYSRHWSGF